jgi:putative transposase
VKKGRFSEEQIIGILKQHEARQRVPDLAREHGISEATIYTWKSKMLEREDSSIEVTVELRSRRARWAEYLRYQNEMRVELLG